MSKEVNERANDWIINAFEKTSHHKTCICMFVYECVCVCMCGFYVYIEYDFINSICLYTFEVVRDGDQGDSSFFDAFRFIYTILYVHKFILFCTYSMQIQSVVLYAFNGREHNLHTLCVQYIYIAPSQETFHMHNVRYLSLQHYYSVHFMC